MPGHLTAQRSALSTQYSVLGFEVTVPRTNKGRRQKADLRPAAFASKKPAGRTATAGIAAGISLPPRCSGPRHPQRKIERLAKGCAVDIAPESGGIWKPEVRSQMPAPLDKQRWISIIRTEYSIRNPKSAIRNPEGPALLRDQNCRYAAHNGLTSLSR